MCVAAGTEGSVNHTVDSSKDAAQTEQPTEDTFFHRSANYLPVTEAVEELQMLGKIACPVLMTTFLIYSKSIISMLFLGRLGKTELAGGALAIGFANVTGFSVMKGLAVAMDPICSQAFGAKRWSLLSQTYLKTFLLLLLASLPISILWLHVENVFIWLGQDPVITKVAKLYLIFSLPELVAHAHLLPLRSFLRTQTLNSPATIVATCATTLHLPINYLLVKHLNLGVKGIALSSVCYSINMNIGLLIYIAFSKVALKPWLGTTLVSTVQGWWPLLSLALPSVCSVCLEWWWYEIILFLGGLLTNPQSAVAAMGILIQTTGAIYIIPYSLNLAISQRVGHELGASQERRAQRAAIVGIVVALGYGVTALGLSLALRGVWGKIYTNDLQTLALISAALPILGLAEVGNAPQTAACGVLIGSAQPKVGVRVNLAAFYLIGLPVAALLGFSLKMGFNGLWAGLVAAQYSCVGMMLYTLYQMDWRYQAKRAEQLTMAAEEEKDAKVDLVAVAA
ncbi:protein DETOXIFICATION 53-like [Diospyros lotus]|uniref:protein DETOXIFICATION 53-like n=1 Tax=Diospyros lotus TaxID=55363 RepID=UPI00224CB6AD|nr:protein DETOXIFICATION 53-like [Diospyros lotus]